MEKFPKRGNDPDQTAAVGELIASQIVASQIPGDGSTRGSAAIGGREQKERKGAPVRPQPETKTGWPEAQACSAKTPPLRFMPAFATGFSTAARAAGGKPRMKRARQALYVSFPFCPKEPQRLY
ncbi:hypothetical protein MTO96_009833 [Rhipicephalus appendiculatus]